MYVNAYTTGFVNMDIIIIAGCYIEREACTHTNLKNITEKSAEKQVSLTKLRFAKICHFPDPSATHSYGNSFFLSTAALIPLLLTAVVSDESSQNRPS